MTRLALFLVIAASLGHAQQQHQKLQSAIALEKSGNLDEAARILHHLLQDSPPKEIAGQAHLELVRIAGRRNNWWEAVDQLKSLRTLAPNNPEYAYQLGTAYQNLSKAAFFHMQAIAPQSARVQQILGEQFSATGDTAHAAEAFRKAIAADPQLPGSHLALAVIHMRLQHRDEALAEIAKELQLSPESVLAKAVQAEILRGQP